MRINDFTELFVYKAAYDAAMEIFELSKGWPKEERYALTDQIRRSSRSVCANIAEAWCKRRYDRHFIMKLSDAEAEAAETINWLMFARDCAYVEDERFTRLTESFHNIRAGLIRMMRSPDKWCGPSTIRDPENGYRAPDL
jgi:four helix bundle protein